MLPHNPETTVLEALLNTFSRLIIGEADSGRIWILPCWRSLEIVTMSPENDHF